MNQKKTKYPKEAPLGSHEKFRRALGLQQQGLLTDAVALYQEILKQNPRHSDSIHCLGTIAAQQQQHERAIKLIELAIRLEPNNYTYHHNKGNSQQALGQLDGAIESYSSALQLHPNSQLSLYNRGVAYLESDKIPLAILDFTETIRLNPENSDAYFNLGNCHRYLNHPDSALVAYEKVIELAPTHLDARLNRAATLRESNAFDLALQEFDKIISLAPHQAKPLIDRGMLWMALAQFEPALNDFNEALKREPENPEALCNRGTCLQRLGRPGAAIDDFKRAIAIDPNLSAAHCNLGISLKTTGELSAAILAYDTAISINPNLIEAYCNKGVAQKESGLVEEAITTLNQAVRLQPDHAESHGNLGVVLQKARRFDAAITSYNRAIELKPVYLDAHYNLALLHQELKQFDAALTGYEHILEIDPDYEYLPGTRLHTKMRLCDWSDHAIELADLSAKIMGNAKASPGFPVVTLSHSAAVQRRAAETWVNDKYPYNSQLGPLPNRVKSKKIRIGYYSADFYNHATSYLMAELFEQHNKDEFEIIGFSFGPASRDGMAKRISEAFTDFIDVRSESDIAIARLSRHLEVDIAVDLKGFTQGQRVGIFSYRAAPIQVNYLGYPGTMGASYMDYIIADRNLIPECSQLHYSENIVYLPDSYQANDRKRSISDRPFTRDEVGLPPEGFVYCCFNNNYKITPSMLDSWARILNAVDGSVLWLLQDNLEAEKNLRREAARRGLDPQRLIFGERLDLPDHLARHRLANLFLDTLPCNAHTTASDALWAGLPVLTCPGETFASRVASSLLCAIKLPELIATSLRDYEDIAIRLARDPASLNALTMKLDANRLVAPLFDTRRYTAKLEDAYRVMIQRAISDQPPAHIDIH